MMKFENVKVTADHYQGTFTLSPLHVTYANTLRRLILTGVETVAFRADMTSSGTTTDVVVKRNDTPMTNEMLAARIGLLPIHVTEPTKWKKEDYQFRLQVAGKADEVRHVTASDIEIIPLKGLDASANSASASGPSANTSGPSADEDEDGDEKSALPPSVASLTDRFFPPHPLTRQTCLLASLQPGSGSAQQKVELLAMASKGTGREHARFIPVSQCSYEYTPDDDPARIQELFESWLLHAKKAGGVERDSSRYKELEREFRTMQIKRCYKIDQETKEPYSYDFTIESVGVLTVDYIVKRACEVGENMCARYVNLATGSLPDEITVSHANCKLVGYDFLFRGHDHTLGNLLQTWIVQNLIEGKPRTSKSVTFAGYSVPHPLRDEMVLRIGVEDGEETTARAAIAEAAKGCVEIFQALRRAWLTVLGVAPPPASAPSSARKPMVMSRPSRMSKSAAPVKP